MKKSSKFLVVVEKTRSGYSAFCPDLPGCVAAARTKSECERLLKSAVKFHLEGMLKEGLRLPKPSAYTTTLSFRAA